MKTVYSKTNRDEVKLVFEGMAPLIIKGVRNIVTAVAKKELDGPNLQEKDTECYVKSLMISTVRRSFWTQIKNELDHYLKLHSIEYNKRTGIKAVIKKHGMIFYNLKNFKDDLCESLKELNLVEKKHMIDDYASSCGAFNVLFQFNLGDNNPGPIPFKFVGFISDYDVPDDLVSLNYVKFA